MAVVVARCGRAGFRDGNVEHLAIVVKMMADRLELESEHGRRVMGVLLFQDLAVVPLLGADPVARFGRPAHMVVALGWGAFKAAALLGVLLVGGQKVMRWWLTLVARRRSEELFILNLLLVTLGLSWIDGALRTVAAALGAFLAGMLIAETEYKHQVETDIRPFHDVLLGLFFITIGMKLDWRPVLDQWLLVLLLSLLPGGGQVRAGDGVGSAVRHAVRDGVDAQASTWRRPANSASCC